MIPGDGERKNTDTSKSITLDELLEQKARLDELFQKKFTRTITVMFTDLKGSTSIAEAEGDVASRILIKNHNDIVFPLIAGNTGVLVKTMGDGTLSYFEDAAAAVRAAVQIQTSIDEYNRTKKPRTPILIRIGLHTGTGIVEKNDIFGDVVNAASRFESLAEATEIYISEDTYTSILDKDEFYCQFIKMATLKGKTGSFKVFKVFWNKEEIEQEKSSRESAAKKDASEQEAVSLEGFRNGILSPVSETTHRPQGAITLQKARDLEKDNELIELYLLCQGPDKITGVESVYQNLKNKLESHEKIDTRLNGKKAVWFFKETITAGRLPEADFQITNHAISRVLIKIGIRNGEGFLKIESGGKGKIKQVELEKLNERKTIQPDIEYALGKHGKIIFSVCFPIKYDIYIDRFLTLEILNPEDCIRKHFNFNLKDVWENYEHESGKMVVIGK